MRQRRLAARIPDRPQPVGQPTGEHVVGIETHRVEPEIRQPRPPPDGDEDLVGDDLPIRFLHRRMTRPVDRALRTRAARPLASRQLDRHRAAVVPPQPRLARRLAATGDDIRLEVDRDPEFPQPGEHRLSREGLLTCEKPTAHDQRDRRPEPRHPRRRLARHDTATDDDEPLRDLDDPGRIARRPRRDPGVDRRDDRHAAGRDDHRIPRAQTPVTDLDEPLADDPTVPADHLQTRRLRPRDLPRIVIPGHPVVAPREHPATSTSGRRRPPSCPAVVATSSGRNSALLGMHA